MDPTEPNEADKHANRDDAVAVVKRLRDAGHVAYFAGGCVRDTLLGLTPKDYDVATDAPPDRVRQLFSNTQAVGAAFGVILVRHRTSVIEVATFRTDLQYKDGRRPDGVVFTTAEEDAKRRDFTINGLFMDPLEGDKVIDYVGGQEDLKKKVLRAIGEPNHRFDEDHLRVLRAIRFAARFDLSIARGTANAIRAHAPQLKRISPERIAQELRLMLIPPTRDRACNWLTGDLLDVILLRFFPEAGKTPHPHALFNLIGALGPPLHRGEISFGLALAAVLVQERYKRWSGLSNLLAPEEIRRTVRAVRTALKISNDEADALAGSLSFGHLIGVVPTTAAMKRFLAQPYSGDARLLMAALARILDPSPGEEIEQVLDRLGALSQTNFAPAPLITGDDLTAAGLQPGPLFKRILDAVYDEQLEGHISSKEQALELALRLTKER